MALLTLLPASLPTRLLAQSDPNAILTRAAQAYAATGSLEANFTQVIADENIGTFRSRGRLAQQGNDRFAMRFSDPRGEALVMDGTMLWIYTPSTTPGQVIRTAQPTGSGAPNLVAWLLDRPTAKYQATYVRRDSTGAETVRLAPRDPSIPFREATVTFAASDGLPRKIDVLERTGTRRTLTLTSVRSGRRLRASTFQFQVPSGVRIVDQ
ncbi:MAG TPA: outer membrane lipoprotein carrier protein LolA [Gemmatimonadales bacterium]|nr:outer membrane lipoprotein carrier protein LolA [Gemmatimonadales bacterium]